MYDFDLLKCDKERFSSSEKTHYHRSLFCVKKKIIKYFIPNNIEELSLFLGGIALFDLSNLNDYEFEILCKDIMQRKLST